MGWPNVSRKKYYNYFGIGLASFAKEKETFIMGMRTSYDLIIVGAGPSGSTAALYAQHFGLDYLVMDQHEFPRDKVCGDALAPVIFSLIKELGLELPVDQDFCKPSGFNFVFSDSESSVNHQIAHRIDSLMFNCTREQFDWKLFSLLRDENRFLKSKLIGVDPDIKYLTVRDGEAERRLSYRWLIIATGSGKSVLDDFEERGNTIYASRAYVKSVSNQTENYVEFFDEVSPGYFWSFPVGKGLYNTGILFHSRPGQQDIRNLHRLMIEGRFSDHQILNNTRFPLRVYGGEQKSNLPDIVAIGDANHSVDPIFGHGIDTGMLEARERVISLKQKSAFSTSGPIIELIKKKNRFSEECKNELAESANPRVKLDRLLRYLEQVNNYYRDIHAEIENSLVK